MPNTPRNRHHHCRNRSAPRGYEVAEEQQTVITYHEDGTQEVVQVETYHGNSARTPVRTATRTPDEGGRYSSRYGDIVQEDETVIIDHGNGVREVRETETHYENDSRRREGRPREVVVEETHYVEGRNCRRNRGHEVVEVETHYLNNNGPRRNRRSCERVREEEVRVYGHRDGRRRSRDGCRHRRTEGRRGDQREILEEIIEIPERRRRRGGYEVVEEIIEYRYE